MRTQNSIGLRRFLDPVQSFIFIYIVCVFLPIIYMVSVDFYSEYWFSLGIDEYRHASRLALTSVILFFISFLAGSKLVPYCFSFAQNESGKRRKGNLVRKDIDPVRFRRNCVYAGIFFALFCWFAFAAGGYTKLSSFGQDYGMLEYRRMGMDSNRIITSLLQVSRRLVLPFVIVYVYLAPYTNAAKRRFLLAFLSVSLLVGAVSTLDRGPFMMIVIMIGYIYYCRVARVSKFILGVPLLVLVIVLFGGLLSYLQHNIQEFSLLDIVTTGTAFFTNRVLLAPSFVAVELSYGLFDFESTKLFLKHSRIMSIFTGSYVDFTSANAIYVGPVGAVGDIWRNLGVFGVGTIGFLLGLYFHHLKKQIDKCSPVAKAALSFTAITLSFYFVFGTFFSQGVFLQIIFLHIASTYFSKRHIN